MPTSRDTQSPLQRVGVVVPVHGEAPFLEETLDSVLRSERPPDRVVVVDDGSPQPVRLEPRHAGAVELIRRQSRGGPGAARQTGLEALDTDLIALADCDDVWERNKLAVQLEALERHPEAAVCFGRAVIVGPDGKPTGHQFAEPPAGPLSPDVLKPILFETDPIPTSSALIVRRALEAAGAFAGPTALPDDWDWDLWLRLVARGETFLCEPHARIRYRRHPGGLTADLAAMAELALRVQDAHRELVDEPTRRRVRARYLTLLGRGRIRQRRYREARAALREAGELAPLGPRERLLILVAAVPGLRAALGRRSHYR